MLLNGRSYQAGWVVLPSGDQRGAASYPSGPVKGNIALVPLLPSCGRWSLVTSPSIGASNNFLNAVSAVSASDVWAVGHSTSSSEVFQTLIEHWNGTTWTIVPSPNPGSKGNILCGVAAVSATNAWAVGDSVTSSGSQTLVEQWNGTTWSVASSFLPIPNAVLYSVSAPFATAIWMAGAGKPTFSSLQETLLVRGNGSAFHPYFQSGGPQGSALLGVAANPNQPLFDVWAVGSAFPASGSEQALTEH